MKIVSTMATLAVVSLLLCALASGAGEPKPSPSRSALISESIEVLVPLQEEQGMWPYEGNTRVKGETPGSWVTPVTYRVGGTSLVCLALLYGARPDDVAARTALDRGLAYVLGQLAHDTMMPHQGMDLDYRVLAQAYSLLLLCHVQKEGRAGGHAAAIRKWMPRLVKALVHERREDGGWSYQNRPVHVPFTTSSVLQALLWARSRGLEVPKHVLKRGAEALTRSRYHDGASAYFGARVRESRRPPQDKLPGTIGRNAICETILMQLGRGSVDRVRASIAAFHEHWDQLEARRRKGTHGGPYQIAPYYFYYGHRYAAQAIELLPEKERETERERMLALLLKTRDPDRTWNDRRYPRARAYGTAMVVLALLSDVIGPPPAFPLPANDEAERNTPAAGQKVQVKTAYVWSPDGKVVNITPTPDEGWYGTPCIHPRGRTVAFAGAARGYGRIWKYTIATRKVVPLTPDTFCSKLPAYSPDGRSIAFAADRDLDKPRFDMAEVGRTRPHNAGFQAGMTSTCNLYVMDANGGKLRRITRGDYHDSRPSFSPDGEMVVFHSNRRIPNMLDMWIVPAGGSSEPTRVKLDGDPWIGRPRFSRNGKEIFFFTGVKNGAYEPRGRHTLCRVAASGGAWSALPNDTVGVSSHGPEPDPDGKHLWYHAAAENMWRIYKLGLAGGAPRRVIPPGFARAHIAHATLASNGTIAFDSRSFVRTPR